MSKDMRECDKCNGTMFIEEDVTDFHDPTAKNGHGQRTEQFWVCEDCDNYEPITEED